MRAINDRPYILNQQDCVDLVRFVCIYSRFWIVRIFPQVRQAKGTALGGPKLEEIRLHLLLLSAGVNHCVAAVETGGEQGSPGALLWNCSSPII